MENLDLQEIRKKLDGIDNQLVELFEKRMALCSDVAEFKIQTGKKVYDGERERQKLDSVMAMADSEFNKKGVYELFSQIMTISRNLQYGLLVRHGQALETGFTMVDDLKKKVCALPIREWKVPMDMGRPFSILDRTQMYIM